MPASLGELRRGLARLSGQRLMPSTLRSYRRDADWYVSFCRQHRLPPGAADSLALFVVELTARRPKSFYSALSGISKELNPVFPALADARSSRDVLDALGGARREFGGEEKKKARPLGASDLQLLVARTRVEDHDDRLLRTLAFSGFHGVMRFADLAGPDADRVDRHTMLRDGTSLEDTADPPRYSFVIRIRKDNVYEGTRVLLAGTGDKVDPVSHFRRYLRSRDRLFRRRRELWLRADGTRPTRSWFIKRLNTALGRPAAWFTGHSLRAGGATWLAERGVSEDWIRRAGRWSSKAWEDYIRTYPALFTIIQHRRRLRRRSSMRPAL